MPTDQGGGRFRQFMRGTGRVIAAGAREVGQAIRHSPVGELATGHPGMALRATPVGRLVDTIMRAGGPRATPVNAFGPVAGGYAGLPQGSGPAGIPATFGGTDWSQFIAPDPNMGPPQYSAPMRDPSINYGRYGANGRNWVNQGVFGGQGSSPGVGRNSFLTPYQAATAMNMNPAGMKQSGIYFSDQQQVF